MTGNDWGGRRKINPIGCEVVRAKDIYSLAEEMGLEVMRGEPVKNGFLYSARGAWWLKNSQGLQLLGITNYVAKRTLIEIKQQQPAE